jgi:hypothetical protein
VSSARAQAGTASIEFLIAFVPFFVLFLGGVQVAFVAAARIVVKHAAVSAVRSAVLAIDDDPFFHQREGSKRKHLSSAPSGGHLTLPGALEQTADRQSSGHEQASRGCSRLSRVRRAAYLPLAVLAPALSAPEVAGLPGVPRDLAGAVDGPWSRVLFGFFLYDRVGSAVTFPEQPGAERLRDLGNNAEPFADDAVVTTRVSYLYACTVPIARELVCDHLLEILAHPGELSHAEWSAPAYAAFGDRFLLLQAEASLPNQGAPYLYASELCKTDPKLSSCEGGS